MEIIVEGNYEVRTAVKNVSVTVNFLVEDPETITIDRVHDTFYFNLIVIIVAPEVQRKRFNAGNKVSVQNYIAANTVSIWNFDWTEAPQNKEIHRIDFIIDKRTVVTFPATSIPF